MPGMPTITAFTTLFTCITGVKNEYIAVKVIAYAILPASIVNISLGNILSFVYLVSSPATSPYVPSSNIIIGIIGNATGIPVKNVLIIGDAIPGN